MTKFRTLSVIFVAVAIAIIAVSGYVALSAGMASHTSSSTTTNDSRSQSGNILYSVGISSKSSLGSYLINGSGWTLYLFTNDTRNSGTSSCYGGCATFWPAFHGSVNNLVLPPGLNSSSFGTITRTDGTQQLEYQGWPLYTFAGDHAAGDTNGQGKFGTWFVVNLSQPGASISSSTTHTTTFTPPNRGGY